MSATEKLRRLGEREVMARSHVLEQRILVRGIRPAYLAVGMARLRIGGSATHSNTDELRELGDEREVMARSHVLFEQRIFVQGSAPPTLPLEWCGFASISTACSDEHIETLGRALR